MDFRSLGCIDPSTWITYLTMKMKTTWKQAEFNYKPPHSQYPRQPTKFPRLGLSDWETCGMNGKNCLVWVERVTRRTDHTDTCTRSTCALPETNLTRELEHRNTVLCCRHRFIADRPRYRCASCDATNSSDLPSSSCSLITSPAPTVSQLVYASVSLPWKLPTFPPRL